MANANLSSSSMEDDLIIDSSPPSTTQTYTKEQLKLKFKLANIDEISNKKAKDIKEKTEEIKRLLSRRTDRFTIVANGINKTHLASWWSNFGFAKETVLGESFLVTNFVSCQHCFTTYRYGSSSTESISRHQCNSTSPTSNKSSAVEYAFTLDKHVFKEKKTFSHLEQQNLTKLFSNWICDNLRPISIVDDSGLREVCSFFYSLGEKHFGRSMDLNTLFQSRQTISRSISNEAKQYRDCLSELIKEPLKSQSLTLSPDMWTDRYRQLSYLGVTVTFVDSHLHFRKFTLCCRSFPVELTKTGENISKVLKEELTRYGIERFDCVQWVSDRGSNFIRCFNLNMIEPIFCFAHRIHNVLTITFINKKIDGYFNDVDIDDIPDNLAEADLLADQHLPLSAKRVLLTIKYTKALVQYVKKSNLNELIVKLGDEGTTTLKQSVPTRWLSLFTCAESVYSNFDTIILALENHRATKYMNDLTKYNLLDILLLLAPLHSALGAIQTDETPSLHLVVPFYQKLLRDYGSYYKLLLSAKKKFPSIFQTSFAVDYLVTEPSGVEFFRQRILEKLTEVFIFDDRHYMAMCLHPAQRELDDVAYQIRNNCYSNIRKYLQENESQSAIVTTDRTLSSKKRRKLLHKFLDEDDDEGGKEQMEVFFEPDFDTDNDIDLIHKPDGVRPTSPSTVSTEFSYRTNYQAFKPDELDQYLEADFPSSIVKENPLEFWSTEFASERFPLLKSLALTVELF
ncbi:unnamed protein product [Adineta ricciae]|uniref:Transposase n=1 Tax=Adineta ricciae TaxID=249248 RepID=A0A815B7X2_ADIRI|nr:unnamed protein product [Adineta ricciae]